MALSWLTALKAVPWADVVQAAPGIVQGARKLFTAAKEYAATADKASTNAQATKRTDALEARLQGIESGLGALATESRASAGLIRSLAEQNANIVAALDVMRNRVRVLTGACIVLAIALVALGLVIALR
jgi:hypothetical protein